VPFRALPECGLYEKRPSDKNKITPRTRKEDFSRDLVFERRASYFSDGVYY
jgi:hypothetical protein